MTEAPPMICCSRGVIDSLVDKLTDVKETHPNVEALLKDLVRLREDLVNKFAGATHWQVNVWMKQSRQLFYDIEDMIDLKLGKNEDMDESYKDFEEQVDEFMARIKEALDRSERYNLLNKVPSTSDVDPQGATPIKIPFDSQLIWENKGVLVGIDNGPKKELAEHLKDAQMKNKVVSVLGMGGLGKTTLATKVYEELNGLFDCHASVTMGRNSSTAALMDVLLQVNPEMVGRALNEQDVISKLWEFLQNKRYFVFVNDIRNKHDWSVISCALPNNDLGSRIFTTTQFKDVAVSCSVCPGDVIYEMKGLDEDDSRSLLLNMIAVQTEGNFEKRCHDMLTMCCGLPLAIIVTSGLLAVKSADLGNLGKLEESSLSMVDQYSTSDRMRDVLNICFADLSAPMKACFLYFSTFPENYTIRKDRLIWRWVAEGFIPKIGHANMWEIGESYFNELICRKLILPILDNYNDDQAMFCTIHPVIHDFIASLSRKEDFHTTAAELISGPFPYGTIRRFSVDCSRKENNEADTLKSSVKHLSRVRSITVFGAIESVPDLGTFKHLRVLDLEDTKSLDDQQAEKIELLFLLRYLGLRGTNITKLPQQIMALKQLVTLDLRRTEVKELPSSGNNKLLSLFVPFLTIPRGMWGFKELEELSDVLLGRDALLNLEGSHADDVAALVNNSRQLRVLGVKFGYLAETDPEGMKHFIDEVGKSNLQSLSLNDYPCDSIDLLVDCWAQKWPHNLRKFELRMSDCLPLVPLKMAYIEVLTHLHIQVKIVVPQDVLALGNFPNLILLKLYSEESTKERLRISSKDGFPCLKVFWFRSSYFHGMGLQFEQGAMPHLQRLKMEFNARKTKFTYRNFDFGIQHLSCLLHMRVIILCKHGKDPEAKAAEAAIRDQVSRIPYNTLPVLRKKATKEAESSSSVDIKISVLPESSSHLPVPGIISSVIEDAMVSSSTGAMNSVLTKLRSMMVKGMDEQELILRDELQLMNGHLKQMSDMPSLSDEMKECRNQMRELTYDIDDSIDDLMIPSLNEEGSESTEKRVMPHDFTDQVQKLNAQMKMANPQSMVRKTERRVFGPRRMCREQWLTNVYYYEIEKLVGRDEPSVESMRKIFADLSSDMKTCLLYFGGFPIDEVLKKDRLIRMWAAEGFLPKVSTETWWETGENFFFELIVRKLIEPVYDEEDVLPSGCKVGGYVHDFITSVSSEEYFIKPGQHGVFWRLSYIPDSNKGEGDELAVQKKFSKVRSLTCFGPLLIHGYPFRLDDRSAFEHVQVSAFKHVRVLNLQSFMVSFSYEGLLLSSIGRLSLLKYLGLEWTPLGSLPQEIIALEHLETVDLRHSMLHELPSFKSRKLITLIADILSVPIEMGVMQVEELSTVSVGVDGGSLAKVVNESKRLRRLGVTIHNATMTERGRMRLMDLLDAIGNSHIQSLRLYDLSQAGSVLLESLHSCWAQHWPRHLKKVVLILGTIWAVPEVPQYMPSLVYLTHLRINVQRMNTEGLCILGNLANLVALSLIRPDQKKYVYTSTTAERSIIKKNGFRCLRDRVFRYHRLDRGRMELQFEAGAMPQLRRLGLYFYAKETKTLLGGAVFGIHYLTCLTQVHASINCWDSNYATVMGVEAALRDQVSRNPNNPVLEIIREQERDMIVPFTRRDKGRTASYPKTKSLETPVLQWSKLQSPVVRDLGSLFPDDTTTKQVKKTYFLYSRDVLECL